MSKLIARILVASIPGLLLGFAGGSFDWKFFVMGFLGTLVLTGIQGNDLLEH